VSKLHTTIDDLLFPKDGSRKHELEQIVYHIEQYGIHYLDKNNVTRHSRHDDKPSVEQMVVEFLGNIIKYETDPIDEYSIEMTREHQMIQHRTGWTQKPKIKKKIAKLPINLNHAKTRKTIEHIVRTLLLETEYLQTIDGPIIDGKLKDLVDAISQQIADPRDIDTYSDILKEIQIHTQQSAKK